MVKVVCVVGVVASVIAIASIVLISSKMNKLCEKTQAMISEQTELIKKNHHDLELAYSMMLDSNTYLVKQNEETQKMIREMHQYMRQWRQSDVNAVKEGVGNVGLKTVCVESGGAEGHALP